MEMERQMRWKCRGDGEEMTIGRLSIFSNLLKWRFREDGDGDSEEMEMQRRWRFRGDGDAEAFQVEDEAD